MNFNSGKRVKQCPVSELNASHRYANDGTIMKAVYHQKKPWIEPRCNVYVQLVHSNQPLDINKDPTACGVSQCIPQSLAIENIIRWVIKKISGFGFCRLYWTFVLSREGNCPSLFKSRALKILKSGFTGSDRSSWIAVQMPPVRPLQVNWTFKWNVDRTWPNDNRHCGSKSRVSLAGNIGKEMNRKWTIKAAHKWHRLFAYGVAAPASFAATGDPALRA